MSISLGKRKRRSDIPGSVKTKLASRSYDKGSSDDDSNDDRAKQLFRRAFEAKFTPLDKAAETSEDAELPSSENGMSDDSNSDVDGLSDWSGLSGEDVSKIEVVELSRTTAGPSAEEIRRGKKGFMSSKPPSSSDEARIKSSTAITEADSPQVDGSEAMNLKHDLALQRLLKESHLLDPTTFQSTSLEPRGKSRLKALDMRLRDLGAKKSALQQERMPMSHRKGIISKAADKDYTRRKEAAENGIVLEKAKKGNKSFAPKRKRGVGDPAVGRFKGGTLSLSSRDVKNIEGQRLGGPGRKGRRR